MVENGEQFRIEAKEEIPEAGADLGLKKEAGQLQVETAGGVRDIQRRGKEDGAGESSVEAAAEQEGERSVFRRIEEGVRMAIASERPERQKGGASDIEDSKKEGEPVAAEAMSAGDKREPPTDLEKVIVQAEPLTTREASSPEVGEGQEKLKIRGHEFVLPADVTGQDRESLKRLLGRLVKLIEQGLDDEVDELVEATNRKYPGLISPELYDSNN